MRKFLRYWIDDTPIYCSIYDSIPEGVNVEFCIAINDSTRRPIYENDIVRVAEDDEDLEEPDLVKYYRIVWSKDSSYPAYVLDPCPCTEVNTISHGLIENQIFEVVGNTHTHSYLLPSNTI